MDYRDQARIIARRVESDIDRIVQLLIKIDKKCIPYASYKKMILRKKMPAGMKHTCAVCLEPCVGGRFVHETPCGHIFHPMCLRSVMCDHGPAKCPMCRTSFIKENENDKV